MTYSDLPIEQKLIVLKRFVSHKVTIRVMEALQKDIRWRYDSKIEEFFEHVCGDMRPGSRAYAVSKSSRCFYCENEFDGSTDGTKTVDHFFPRRHFSSSEGKIGRGNRFVVSCHSCNNWKGGQHPNRIIRRIKQSQLPKLCRMNEISALKIEKILTDIRNDIGPKYYYI